MALSKIVSSSLANGSVSIASITDNTVTSAKLTSTGVVANSYGNTTAIPVITVDAQGRITNATTSSVSGVTGLSFTPANSTITVSTSTTNFDAVVTSGNSTVQGLLTVLDSVSNTSTSIAASANSVTTAYQLAANAVSNATAYAATAYSNAVTTAASDATTKAGTAYSNATSYANTAAGTAYSNAISYANTVAYTAAGTAYSNAVATAASDATTKAGTAYSNAIIYANTIAYTAADTAYANAVTYANTKANAAYSNVFNGGTFSGAVIVQANLTANSVRLNGDLQIDGNLTVLGNTVSIYVSSLNVEDNLIYLNSNSTTSNPDLGFAGNYNDGSYKHAGLFRDATDGVWKFFHGYTPEPDASAFIDTANASFTLSNLQINYVIGNVTGSANSATYLGGNTAATLRSYSDTIAGTAYSNATTYAATIAGTAYSNAVSVAASDATTKAGTAYSNATTYAATIAGTAYSNAVSVAASDATTKAGTAYSNATTYAATIAGTAYSNAVSIAASDATTKAGTAYSNAVAYAASNTYVNSTFLKLTGGTLTGATQLYAGTGGYSPAFVLGGESTLPNSYKAMYLDNYWFVLQGHVNEGFNFRFANGSSTSNVGIFTSTYFTHTSSIRSPIFYDYNDTGYYLDPNATPLSASFNGNIQLNPQSASWAEGIQFYMPNQSTWGGIRWVRNRSNYYGSWYIGWTALDSSNDIVFGANVSGTQVDNILRLYSSATGSARIGRDLYLSGLTGGNYGNRLIIGATDTAYTTQDSNVRPTLQLHGQYPVVSLNHTVTSNASHGPTLQFTANGTGRQYVIGMNGQGSFLDIGFSTATDWNPHNGIASYNGTTGWRMDASGNVFNYISSRAPIFYDSDDTAYYVNPNSSSYLQGHTRFGPYAGSITTGNQTGVEIMNNGGTGDGNVAAISFHCQGTYGLHLHLRNDGYFGMGGWSATTWRWYVLNTTGDMTAAGNVTAYSDPRLKEDVKVIESAIDKIKQLNGVKFRWIESSVIGHPGEYDYGILSTDVEKIAPELVVNSIHEAPEGDFYKTVAYDKLVAFTIEAIKEQQKLIEILVEKVKVLESK